MRLHVLLTHTPSRAIGCRGVAAVCCALAIGWLAPTQDSAAQPGAQGSEVRTIRIDAMGEGSAAQALRQRMIERLNQSGRLRVIDKPATPDLILRGSSGIWATGTVSPDPRSKSLHQVNYAGFLSVELTGNDG